jgi:hypothetical protein
MVKYTGKHFDRVSVKVESIVAELVDNSVAADAKNIQVVLMRDVDAAETCKRVSTEGDVDLSQSFSITVIDNGDGFESEEQLHNDFELGEMPDEEKERKSGESGLFFVGMKESTMNKFHHFSMMANIDGEVHSRSIRFPGNESEWSYEHLPYPSMGSNPCKELPEHLVTHEWLKEKIANPEWATLAHASVVRKPLIDGDLAENFDESMEDFQHSLSLFLGVVYRDNLLNKNFGLKIIRIDEYGIEKSIKVEPVDLFCENLTPNKLIQHINDESNELTDEEKYTVETSSGFGTLMGPRYEISFEYLGGIVNAYLTPFLLPRDNVRALISETLGNTINGERVIVKSDGNFSKIWKAENIQGFSYIRGGRMIVIGNHDKADNYGFYKAEAQPEPYSWPMANAKTRVRFKVEYDISEHNDAAFHLFMNKNGYVDIADKFFEIGMKKLGEISIDGSARGMAKPHNISEPFYKTRSSRHYHPAAKATSNFHNNKIGPCSITGCKALHFGDSESARAKICLKRPCKSCGRSLESSECTPNVCNMPCTLPRCPTGKGHKQEECPSLKCTTCELLLDDCICCGVCGSITQNGICLSCPCPECGVEFDEHGNCGCDPPEPPEPESLPEGEDEYGTRHVIEYYPENKDNSLKAIKTIIEEANLSVEELNFE